MGLLRLGSDAGPLCITGPALCGHSLTKSLLRKKKGGGGAWCVLARVSLDIVSWRAVLPAGKGVAGEQLGLEECTATAQALQAWRFASWSIVAQLAVGETAIDLAPPFATAFP